LFPHHLNIYGDRGNILTLKYRAKKRNIEVEIVEINSRRDKISDDVNLIFGGGGQDKQQEYVSEELQFFKEKLHELISALHVPALTICGMYQLFGNYFKTFDGKEIKGISVFDLITVASKQRKIGNVVIKLNEHFDQRGLLADKHGNKYDDLLVGFENHSGNTFLSPGTVIPAKAGIQVLDSDLRQNDKYSIRKNQPEIRINSLGAVIKGYGNNGEDGQEGAVINNCIGTYLHGPLLPKNPRLADWLIVKALKIDALEPIDDSLEQETREKVISKILNS
jgi:lipid II isoglutaminyl synthase (glutamine-hydrolysing)